MSLLAKTLQRPATAGGRLDLRAIAPNSSMERWRRWACWSRKEPVPAAQAVFMEKSATCFPPLPVMPAAAIRPSGQVVDSPASSAASALRGSPLMREYVSTSTVLRASRSAVLMVTEPMSMPRKRSLRISPFLHVESLRTFAGAWDKRREKRYGSYYKLGWRRVSTCGIPAAAQKREKTQKML